jgi:hypothetical protein
VFAGHHGVRNYCTGAPQRSSSNARPERGSRISYSRNLDTSFHSPAKRRVLQTKGEAGSHLLRHLDSQATQSPFAPCRPRAKYTSSGALYVWSVLLAATPGSLPSPRTKMAPPNTRARANRAVEQVTGQVEFWALVAAHRGVVGACQLRRVCKDARVGCDEYLSSLPGLVVCGGRRDADDSSGEEEVSEVLRLNLATMRWVPMPALVTARYNHACCAVRGTLVVLGGDTPGGDLTSGVERLSSSEEGGAFVDLPPLSCGAIAGAAAVAVEESDRRCSRSRGGGER